jgi:RNA binding exosome subunit
MRYAHYIGARVFCKEGDDEPVLRDKFMSLMPNDEKNKVRCQVRSQIISDEKKLKIYTVDLKRQTHINKFLRNLSEKMSEGDKLLILDQLDSRLDAGFHLFIRLDKEKFLSDIFDLTDGGNCIHIKIAVAAYPHTREAAEKVINKFVSL